MTRDNSCSWYKATQNKYPQLSRLSKNTSCDVCIVGGGLAGLSCALELIHHGSDVVLLESGSIGFGASGRNAGLVAPGFAQDINQIINRVGLQTARELWQLSVDGVEYVRRTINSIDKRLLMSHGSFCVSRTNDEASLQDQINQLNHEFDYHLDYYNTQKTRTIINSQRYYGALYDRRAFSIHPLNYALALADKIKYLGGRVYDQTPAVAITDSRIKCEVLTAQASIKCQNIIIATSAYDTCLHPELNKTILPVATYMGMTEDLGESVNKLLNTQAFIFDTRRAGDYYRKIGNQLLWGGRISTRVSSPDTVAQMIADDIVSVFDHMEKPKMVYDWYGLMGYSRHKMPLIYPFGQHLWLVSGFGGHGLNTSAMAAQLVAAAVCQNDDRWKLFANYQSPWNGGMVGRGAVQINYWILKVKDWLDERRLPG